MSSSRFSFGDVVLLPDGKVGTVQGGVATGGDDKFAEADVDAMVLVLVEGHPRLFNEDSLQERLS